MLRTHRAYDIGAKACAVAVARRLGAPLVLGGATRLLVDLNRRPDRRACLSAFTRGLSPLEKARLLGRHHAPYRTRAESLVGAVIGRGRAALHLSMHSFVPVLKGNVRHVDVGVLYDPARPAERAVAVRVAGALRRAFPGWRVRANQPYRGVSDGLTSYFRTRFPARRYAGLEIEVNQSRLTPRRRAATARRLADALAEAAGPDDRQQRPESDRS